MSLSPIDLTIIVIYFVFVLGLGFYLRKFAKTGEDFFSAGHGMTAWIAGLSFISANLGSLEMMGYAAATYQYGILIAHAYWIGAIPAILFLSLVMLPFYYICKTHSVPGYLQLRYGEGARSLSAISFAVMTILMSGINMYSMAVIMKVILGWNIHFSIWVSSLTVAIYVMAGGLLSAIYTEVLQFLLIWLGVLVIPIAGLAETGGWSGLVRRISENFPGQDFTHMWSNLGSFTANPMGVHWTGIVFGWGLAISFGYWTTDFLVVQRVMAAKDLRSAQMGTIIGSFFKMMVPLIVILPGLLALGVLPFKLVPETMVNTPGVHTYNEALPLMLARYCGPGLLGLGVTALIAGFMSGMAGNVSAFATVWTYDIYKPLLRKQASDAHYLSMGRWCSLLGVIVSIGTAYLVMNFSSIIVYAQAVFVFFIVPMFGTVVLGMMWKRTTPSAGFWGLLAGILVSFLLWLWVKLDPPALRYVAFSSDAKDMAENLYRAMWSLLANVLVTVVVTLFTKPKPEEELQGLVYGLTTLPSMDELPIFKRPAVWAGAVAIGFVVLNILFW
ncbi:MAG: sodium:solute symporter family protein [Acidobacteria bacterium]|nr:sodium:solute symporter family protein [Acidobacteriota bacterium]MBS1864492.1 sodium:solute symporter family protein [Acidobacteriota bacterium]